MQIEACRGPQPRLRVPVSQAQAWDLKRRSQESGTLSLGSRIPTLGLGTLRTPSLCVGALGPYLSMLWRLQLALGALVGVEAPGLGSGTLC